MALYNGISAIYRRSRRSQLPDESRPTMPQVSSKKLFPEPDQYDKDWEKIRQEFATAASDDENGRQQIASGYWFSAPLCKLATLYEKYESVWPNYVASKGPVHKPAKPFLLVVQELTAKLDFKKSWITKITAVMDEWRERTRVENLSFKELFGPDGDDGESATVTAKDIDWWIENTPNGINGIYQSRLERKKGNGAPRKKPVRKSLTVQLAETRLVADALALICSHNKDGRALSIWDVPDERKQTAHAYVQSVMSGKPVPRPQPDRSAEKDAEIARLKNKIEHMATLLECYLPKFEDGSNIVDTIADPENDIIVTQRSEAA